MSLYNMIHGQNPISDIILATLGLTKKTVGRFRDVYLEDNKICVYTRNGGGNRECYEEKMGECFCNGNENYDCFACVIGTKLPEHPQYIKDEDDDFDCTYATIYFSFPEEYKEELTAIQNNTNLEKPSEKWEALFKYLEKKETV